MVWVGVWAGARAVGVPAFLPSGLCSRWMWNLRCPFRLKLLGRDEGSGVALPSLLSSPSPPVAGLTAAHRGGMKKASRWCGSACAAAGPSCSWKQSCTGCTGEAAGSSAAPCGPTGGAGWGASAGSGQSSHRADTEPTLGSGIGRRWVKNTNQTKVWCCMLEREKPWVPSLGHLENPVPAFRLSLPLCDTRIWMK